MKKWIISLIAAMLIMTSTVYADNIDIIPVPFNETQIDAMSDAVVVFNAHRRHLGIEGIKLNETLKQMAKYHSRYMAYNGKLTSIEDSEDYFFRGRYPWDRAVYYKYDKNFIYEFVQKDSINFENGLTALLNDPVSRYFMLDAMYTDIGIAEEDGYFTFEIGGNGQKSNLHVNYPYPTQKDVPVTWKGDSFDELYDGVDLKGREVGLPVTTTYYGDDFEGITDISVMMMNLENNSIVPFKLIKPGDYYLLPNTLTILPLTAYEYDTQYQVHIKFNRILANGDEREFIKIYSFTTEARPTVSALKSPYITRGHFTEALVRNLGYSLIDSLEPKFSDVSLSSSIGRYIYTAESEGLINVNSATKFGPQMNITREQAYVIFVRAFENNKGNDNKKRTVLITDLNQLKSYEDESDVSIWAYNYVLKAKELGIVVDVNGNLAPSDYLTEEDFNRMLALYNKNTEGLN